MSESSSNRVTVKAVLPSEEILSKLTQMSKDDPALFDDQKRVFREEIVKISSLNYQPFTCRILNPEEAIETLAEGGMDVKELRKRLIAKKEEMFRSFWDKEILPRMRPETLYKFLAKMEMQASYDLPFQYEKMLYDQAEKFISNKQ